MLEKTNGDTDILIEFGDEHDIREGKENHEREIVVDDISDEEEIPRKTATRYRDIPPETGEKLQKPVEEVVSYRESRKERLLRQFREGLGLRYPGKIELGEALDRKKGVIKVEQLPQESQDKVKEFVALLPDKDKKKAIYYDLKEKKLMVIRDPLLSGQLTSMRLALSSSDIYSSGMPEVDNSLIDTLGHRVVLEFPQKKKKRQRLPTPIKRFTLS